MGEKPLEGESQQGQGAWRKRMVGCRARLHPSDAQRALRQERQRSGGLCLRDPGRRYCLDIRRGLPWWEGELGREAALGQHS